ncbi:unnamed protein product [Prorocentrum cordatum]|uniref:C3H1-type domain-containing protein n=1 Tax=Prorocentrum cordatum TaxID=2364126 RepID=A0ABN9SQE9_9DINO|nr:unnamed protein product [Polarella glacialis]
MASRGGATGGARPRRGGEAGREGHETVMWKATFIEVGDDEPKGSLSPRPSSEPCSESSSYRVAFFDADRMRAAALSRRMEEAWASNSRETMRNSLEKRRMSAAADTIHLLPEQLSSVVQIKAESLADSVKLDLSLVQKAIRRSGGDGDVVDVAVDQLDKIPEIIRSSFDSKILEANVAIRMKLSAIMQTLKSLSPESQEVQLWSIPEELEQITGEAVDQAVQESKRKAASCCDHVLRSLPEDAGFSRRALKEAKSQIVESVPEMYSQTMRALRSTTNANVRHAVACMDDLKQVPVTNHLVADVLLRAKMSTLPQTDGASLISPASTPPAACYCVKDGGADGASTNHHSQVQASLAPHAECTHHSNPGSLGHPEMCVRPCLYFARGQCTSGDGCRFCHCPHPARPVHLGRSHRRAMEATTMAECFGILLPVLERKMLALRLSTGTLQLLADQQCAGPCAAPVDAGSRAKPRELRTLGKAFGALSMRSLLVVLQKKVGAQNSREKVLLDALMLEVREAGFLVDLGEEVQEDA